MILPINTIADGWGAAILTTLALAAVSSIVAVLIGIPSAMGAVLLAESRSPDGDRVDRLQSMFVRIWIAGMLFSIATPLILHAAAWESTAGQFGWLVKTITGGNLLWVGWIHGVHGAAIVAAVTYWSTRTIPSRVLRHARLDFSPVGCWWRVRLPIAVPWVTASVVIVWLLAATEMSVADLHSVRTVADQFYLFYSLDPTFTSVAMATFVPWIVGGLPCIILFLVYRQTFLIDMNPSPSSFTQPVPWFVCVVSGVVVGGSLLVILGAIGLGLVLQTGHSVRVEGGRSIASWSMNACLRSLGEAPLMFAVEYGWTVQLAGLVVVVIVPVTWMMARISRVYPTLGWGLDALTLIVFIIPGPVIAMAVVRLFAIRFPGSEMLATQTLVPTMIAVSVRAGVFSYVILRLAYRQISESVWRSGRMDGGLLFRMWAIELPSIRPAIVIACVSVAIIASGDVPATLPVLPPGVTTVGTRLFGLLHSGSRYQEASLAFWYFAALLLMGAIAFRFGSRFNASADTPPTR